MDRSRSGYRDLHPEITEGDISYHQGNIEKMLQQIGKRTDKSPEYVQRNRELVFVMVTGQ